MVGISAMNMVQESWRMAGASQSALAELGPLWYPVQKMMLSQATTGDFRVDLC